MKRVTLPVSHLETESAKWYTCGRSFVIACAWAKMGTVVTEERIKPNAAKIPNVCEHYVITCVNLEGFMSEQGWSF